MIEKVLELVFCAVLFAPNRRWHTVVKCPRVKVENVRTPGQSIVVNIPTMNSLKISVPHR